MIKPENILPESLYWPIKIFYDDKIIKEIDLHTKTLKEVLDSNMIANQHIDFMTIDVEGLDYDVLVSNDWAKYKPSILLIEDVGFDLHNMGKSKVYNYLIGKGYSLIVKIFNTLFFELKDKKLSNV